MFDLPSNVTQLVEILPITNNLTNGLLGLAILLLVGFITLFITSTFNMKDSLLTTGFVVFTVGFFLRYLGLINDMIMFGTLVIFMIVLVVSYSTKGGGA